MSTQNHPLRQQIWFSEQEYPFKSHYLQLPEGRLHYLDEGKGEAIVLVHGTPSWSFLYREQVKVLSRHYRVIAPDHLGYGLSDKPANADYSPQAHAERLQQLLNKLNLGSFSLAVHDFGGPIGLACALENPVPIQKLVIFNTWLWSLEEEKYAHQADKLLKSWLGRILYKRLNFSAKVLLKSGFHDKKKLSKNIHRHYTAVFPTRREREAPYQMGLGLLGASDWYDSLWNQRHKIEKKPILLLWGMKDPYLSEKFMEKWQQHFPNARVVKLE